MERDVRYFAKRLESLQVQSKLVEADSVEGISFTENYDLLARPSLVLATDNGVLIERWQGELPLVENVSYLAHQS